MIVYPMGLPPHDPIRMELENQEDLSGTQVCQTPTWIEGVESYCKPSMLAALKVLPKGRRFRRDQIWRIAPINTNVTQIGVMLNFAKKDKATFRHFQLNQVYRMEVQSFNLGWMRSKQICKKKDTLKEFYYLYTYIGCTRCHRARQSCPLVGRQGDATRQETTGLYRQKRKDQNHLQNTKGTNDSRHVRSCCNCSHFTWFTICNFEHVFLIFCRRVWELQAESQSSPKTNRKP